MKTRMNKKGQADFIGNILKLIPKPIIFLFFILLLSGITLLLNPVFNSFGIFCDSGKEVIKLPESNIITNIALMSSLPSAKDIGSTSIEPNHLHLTCKKLYKDKFRYVIGGGGNCYSCPSGIIDNMSDDRSYTYCSGDVFRWTNPKDNVSLINRKLICPLLICQIPENYYYSVSTGKYECLTDCSSQRLSEKRDAKLLELGGYPYYAYEKDDNSYEGLIMFGCSKSLRVVPTLKGIPLFDLQFWAIGILIIILLGGIIKFAKK